MKSNIEIKSWGIYICPSMWWWLKFLGAFVQERVGVQSAENGTQSAGPGACFLGGGTKTRH